MWSSSGVNDMSRLCLHSGGRIIALIIQGWCSKNTNYCKISGRLLISGGILVVSWFHRMVDLCLHSQSLACYSVFNVWKTGA